MNLRRLLDDAEKELGGEIEKIVSAPGRADFLNTHQDYKGLPVIPVAIKLRCYAAGYLNNSSKVKVTSLNLKDQGRAYVDSFDLKELKLRGGGWFGDYVRAVFKVFIENGFEVKGMNLAIRSDVPIGAGLSSSAALEVSVAKLISELNGLNLDKKGIAEFSYKAEHDVMRIPCGRLDQYASSFGGVIMIENRPPFKVEELPMRNFTFVIADSGQHRRIISVHPVRQSEINQALKILIDEVKPPPHIMKYLDYEYHKTRWENLVDVIDEYLDSLPEKLARRIIFTTRTHKSTMFAVEIMKGQKPTKEKFVEAVGREFADSCRIDFSDPLQVIGAIMNYQHALLRDYYEVSTPKLEELRDLLLETGALGAKISGAGMGGAIIALAKSEKHGQAIKKQCMQGGYSSVWVSPPDEGARVETI
ncbi:MAG: GHMP kinase [Thaumarchaeota archaeon]|nr:GHMP kinase [Nitrososphaerota archaeon]